MKQTINQSGFIDAFRACDRYDQFGYDALVALFNYLEEMHYDIELDVITLCCEYAVDSVADVAWGYSIDIEGLDDDEAREAVLDYLNENTMVIDDNVNGQILYCSSF